MPFYLDSFKNDLPLGCTNDLFLSGLDTFVKSLEKNFYSKATVRNSPTETNKVDLVIELECNFNLVDVIGRFNCEIFTESIENKVHLARAINELQKNSTVQIDIEEFSLQMLDTTIVVHRIYEQSIPEQWNNIMTEVVKRFDFLIQNRTETPFEIYIPVLEEDSSEKKPRLEFEDYKEVISANDYYTFWGLYFDSEEDAVIYDVKNSFFIYEDLYLLKK